MRADLSSGFACVLLLSMNIIKIRSESGKPKSINHSRVHNIILLV